MASNFAPPPGVVPDPDHPKGSLFPAIVATFSVCVALTTISTATRLAVKRAVSSFNIEDYLSVLAWILFLGFSSTVLAQGFAGIGRHIWDVRPGQGVIIAKESWAAELSYCVVTMLAKVTLLLQLQRTFCPSRVGAVFVICQTVIWTIVVFNIVMLFVILFQCVPQAKIWDPTIQRGRCLDTYAIVLATGIANASFDLPILIVPIWSILKLQMVLKRKIDTVLIFALGVIANVASLGRLVFTVNGLKSSDSTHVIAQIGLWAMAEITSVIICTSIPFMPRLFRLVSGQENTSRRRYLQDEYRDLSGERRKGNSSGNIDGSLTSIDLVETRHSNLVRGQRKADFEDTKGLTEQSIEKSRDTEEGNQEGPDKTDSVITKITKIEQWRETRGAEEGPDSRIEQERQAASWMR